MQKIILSLGVLGFSSFLLMGCNEGSSGDSRTEVGYGVRFAATDDMLTDDTFSLSPCDDMEGDNMCATPAEYRLGLDSVNLVSCSGTCKVSSDKQGFSNDIASVDLENSNTAAAIIAGSTYVSKGKSDSGFSSAKGVTVNMRYVEADFPDNSSVEATYRGATVRLCLKAGCVTGAARGDYLVKLSGESTFKWYDLDSDDLVATKPTNFLKEAGVTSGSVDGVGFSSSQGIVPTILSAALTPTSSTKNVVVKVDVGRSLYCEDTSQNGVCSPSDGEAFWIHFPPDTFEFSLE